MNISMTGQEKGDLLIEVTTWAGWTVSEEFRQMHVEILGM